MNLYIYTYNNYYNRIMKQAGDNISDYEEYLHYGPIQGVYGFTPGDGINTLQIIGNNAMAYDGLGDYLIAHNPFLNKIDSRWFIIDSVRTRDGQWQLTLRRDLIVDFQPYYLNAPMYIEKATLPSNDPFIFNSENVSVNQIKTKEYQLRDKSNCSWIVGYLSRTDEEGGKLADLGPYSIKTVNSTYDIEMSIEDFEELMDNTRNYKILSDSSISFNTRFDNDFNSQYLICTLSEKTLKWTSYVDSTKGENLVAGLNLKPPGLFFLPDTFLQYYNNLSTSVKQQLINIAKMSEAGYNPEATIAGLNNYLQYNDKIIKVINTDATYTYYKISAKQVNNGIKSFTISQDLSMIDGTPAIQTYLTNVTKKFASDYRYTVQSYLADQIVPQLQVKETTLDFEVNEITEIDLEYTIPGTRSHLLDAPYDMFCIPYAEDGFSFKWDNNYLYAMNAVSALSFAQSLAENLGSNLLDLQLLPYCPMSGWFIDTEGLFTINSAEVGVDITINTISSTGTSVIVFYCKYSKGSINSEQLHLVDTETNETVVRPLYTDNVKLSNECDLYRLSSPNWNGQFDFNPAKCGLDDFYKFNVDYTYLPYSPYIHVNPNFSQLYGKDFDDARGLICQGDFSISYMSDKWAEYQVQNKNFANIFARQQENLETTHEINRAKQITEGVVSSVGSGIGVGFKTGNVAAGIATGIMSAAGTAADVAFNEKLHSEALDYNQDMYNFNLDNIQALPDSLAKVTAFNNNNKIFPILEYYTCTDIEKQALANKIAYNGMTTMRIGTMSDFIGNTWEYDGIISQGYIKGKLIKATIESNHIENLHGNSYNVINALSGELNKGVFIQ